jgi:beta-phosphoglucomutase
MPVRVIIFDLDGTLADTEQLHFEAFNAVLRPRGIEISRADYFGRLIGFDDQDCFALLLDEHRRSTDLAAIRELIKQKSRVYQAIIAEREVLFPGAAEFVRKCADRFPLALVTGTLRAEAETILCKAQLRNFFADIVAAEDVEHGKPEPEGFNTALGHLGCILRPHPPLMPKDCLVIEDTTPGIEAALRAGMRVLAVAQTVAAARLEAADIVRASLAETDLDEVLRQLAIRH